MSYYLLKCPVRSGDAVLSDSPDLPPPMNLWNRGVRFTGNVPEPLQFSIDEEDSGEMPPIFDTGAHLLMSAELVEELVACGVDNIDTYDAIVHDKVHSRDFLNYRAVNIVGLVSAVDSANSIGTDVGLVKDGLITMWFDKLAIDEAKAKGALLFRLAEKLSYILVHESVKRRIEARNFDGLSFQAPSDI